MLLSPPFILCLALTDLNTAVLPTMVSSLKLALASTGTAFLAWLLWPRHRSWIQIPPYRLERWGRLVPFSTYTYNRLLYMLPWDIIKYFVLETSSSAGLDRRDVTGESPYIFSSVVAGQIWTATYCYQMDALVARLVLSTPSLASDDELLAEVPEEKRELMRKDLEKCRWVGRIDMQEGLKGRYFKEGLFLETRMIVVKLVTGGVLLYSPVKIDEEVKCWIASLPGGGSVKIIVSPSAAQHAWVSSAQAAFPEATVVTGDSAGVKLSKANARVDINYNTAEGKQSLGACLQGSLSYVACDADPNQELILFHLPTGTAICTDLIYTKCDLERGRSRSDGRGATEYDIAIATHPDRWAGRLFRAIWLDRSPNGILPIYRYRLIDPHHFRPGGAAPADEWTAQLFREEVRKVLQEGAAIGAKRLVSCSLDEHVSWGQAEKVIKATWDFLKL